MLLLNVPFNQKDEAKALGARWNPEIKKWYVEDKKSYSKFRKWFIRDNESGNVICDYIYIIEGRQRCFKCNEITRVIGYGIENFWEFDNDGKAEYSESIIRIMPYVKTIPNELLEYVNKNYNYKRRFSKTTESVYWANCCDHCDVLQGNWYLFNEPDSPFSVEDKEQAEELILYKFKLKYDIVTLDAEIGYGSEDYLIKKYGKIINKEIIKIPKSI